MSGVIIPMIEFDLFWKVSGISLITDAGGLVLNHISKIDELKAKIKQSVGKDVETQTPYYPQARVRKLLKYNVSRRLSWLHRCLVLSVINVMVYAFCQHIPFLSDAAIYRHSISISTYLGIAPSFFSLLIVVDLVGYMLRLYSESLKGRP
jgi:hypothetical protein